MLYNLKKNPKVDSEIQTGMLDHTQAEIAQLAQKKTFWKISLT